MKSYSVILILLSYEQFAECLRLVSVSVPTHVAVGSRARLGCEWTLSSIDRLYSVKWYKDGKEFFRYVPGDRQPVREYRQPGVTVEKSDHKGSTIELGPATLETAGRYRCEVSGERPLFPTVTEHADMTVVALPKEGPKISGTKPRYSIGEHVQAFCESSPSKPAAKLVWFVNDSPASIGMVRGPTRMLADGGLERTSLNLQFDIDERHFIDGRLKLKCLATIASVYWKSNEESIEGEHLRTFSNEHESITIKQTSSHQRSSSERTIAYVRLKFTCLAILYFFPMR